MFVFVAPSIQFFAAIDAADVAEIFPTGGLVERGSRQAGTVCGEFLKQRIVAEYASLLRGCHLFERSSGFTAVSCSTVPVGICRSITMSLVFLWAWARWKLCLKKAGCERMRPAKVPDPFGP